MLNLFKREYVVSGTAIDIDAFDRIKPQIAGYAFEDMFNRGYEPLNEPPSLKSTELKGGKVRFTLKWKCREIGR